MLFLFCFAAMAQEHGGPVRALAVAPDGAVASAGFDQSVILWRSGTVLRWHQGAVAALVALPSGGFASAGEDARIAIWTTGPEPLRTIEGHEGPIAGLAARGDLLASAGRDGTVRLGTEVFRGHQGPVNGVAFLADGTLASAGYDGTIRLWPEGRVVLEAGLPLNTITALPTGGFAAGSVDGTVRIADRELTAGTRPVVALAAAPDGGILAAASLGGDVTLWSLPEGRVLRTLQGPGLPVWSLAFAPDGRSLWTGGADRRVRRWDVATGRETGPLAAPVLAEAPPAFRACAACHALREGGPTMAGPSLHGVFGRRMGTLPGYHYSPRLAQGDVIWTRETIADLFTRGPNAMLPGTRMPEQVVSNAEDLAALLDYLEAASR